jgi:hypothetical protein
MAGFDENAIIRKLRPSRIAKAIPRRRVALETVTVLTAPAYIAARWQVPDCQKPRR